MKGFINDFLGLGKSEMNRLSKGIEVRGRFVIKNA
jgi:hypothetical protein